MDRALAVFIALPALAGCGRAVPPFECGTVGPVVGDVAAFNDAARRFYRADCRFAARCGEIGASEESGCESSDLDALDEDRDFLAGLRHEVQCGALSFDVARATDCVTAVENASCDTGGDAEERCLEAFALTPPWVVLGGACRWTSECVSGACVTPPDQVCVGSCQPLRALGETCGDTTAPCAPGGTCHGSVCISVGHPVGTVPEGGNCLFPDDKGMLTDYDDSCQAGMLCRNQNVCTRPGGEGTICVDSRDCLQDFFCDGPIMFRGGACRAARVPAGTACDPQHDMSCLDGLFCLYREDAIPPICKATLPLGATCGPDDRCSDGLACIGFSPDNGSGTSTSGVCSPWLDLGSPCTQVVFSVSGCPEDMTCIAGVCASSSSHPGDACNADAFCGGGLYCDDSNHCAVPLPRGADCPPQPATKPDSCTSGYSCDPTTHTCIELCGHADLFDPF